MKYKGPRQLEYWLKVDPKETRACDTNVRRILSMSAPDFVELLKARGHL